MFILSWYMRSFTCVHYFTLKIYIYRAIIIDVPFSIGFGNGIYDVQIRIHRVRTIHTSEKLLPSGQVVGSECTHLHFFLAALAIRCHFIVAC